jgi:signal peptidase I
VDAISADESPRFICTNRFKQQPIIANQMKPKQPRSLPKPKVENSWVETGKTILLSVVFAFGFRTYIAESCYIPSGSMLPTLQINDRLMVDKISYRFSNPARGDMVVFAPPAVLNVKDNFIKRVIGLPGDRVEVKAGKVYINGKILTEKYVAEAPNYTWTKTESSDADFTPNRVVPEGQYLVLGDNRNNSLDSHYWGFVAKDKIVGKAIVRYWPISRTGGIEPQPDYR